MLHTLTRGLIVSLCISLGTAAYLQVFQALQPGTLDDWTAGPIVKKEGTLCPDDLPKPFTLICLPKPGSSSTSAEFYVDNVLVKTESQAPYAIAGDTAERGAEPWKFPSATATMIKCKLSTGEIAKAELTFKCEGAKGDDPGRVPVAAPEKPKPRKKMKEYKKPKSYPKPAKGTKTTAYGEPDSCVKISAASYDSLKPKLEQAEGIWVKDDDAGTLAYKPNDPNSKTDKAGVAYAEYTFTARETANYVFTLDMSTKGKVDFNDVWVMLVPDGFILRRYGSFNYAAGRGWTKAYHNKNGRSNIVYSVDHNPHTFYSKKVLTKGQTYTVKVGGRSTMVTLHNIILFPCIASKNECAGHTSYWRAGLQKCSS